MLTRETQIRNSDETQKQLDDLDPEQQRPAGGDAKQPETLDEAREMIAALRAQLQAVAGAVMTPQTKLQEDRESLHEAAVATPTTDKQVYESIKARVVREFGLGPEYVDVLNSAVSRFPGDTDIVASANYLRYNRAVQGTLGD